jgi:transglutaminase-like putative cysteine protease
MSPALAVRLAAYLLVADGLVALVLAGLLGPVGLAVVGAALVLSWWQAAIRARIHTRALGAVLVGVAAVASAVDLLYVAETVLDGLVHMLLFLVLARLFTADSVRDARTVAFLAFFMLVAASSAAFGVGFLFVFIAFLLLSTWLLLLQHMLVESEPAADRTVAGPPQWASARMLLGLAAAASIATFLITTALFFVIPRVGLAALPFRGKIGSLVTGFSDRVELGAYGQIQTDTSVAMRVHVTGEVPPEALPTLRWRGIVFDEFDGRAWSVSHTQRTTLRRSLASDYRVGAFRGRGPFLTQEFFLEPIGTEVIFAAPRALRIEIRASEITLDDMGTVTVPSAAARLHYRVESELETPPPPSVRPTVRPPADDPSVARYLQLPRLAPRIPALAREVARGGDARETAIRLSEHLSREYRYSLNLARKTRLDPLEEFLFVSRSGNCEYFAAALAVMLRSQGVPARVVGGFQRGEWNPYGRYFTVRMRDAHAWVEAYLPGAGWVTFDPSPRAEVESAATGTLLYLDALRLRWYRYVINWSLRDQVEMATTIRRQAGSWGIDWTALREWRPAPAHTVPAAVVIALLVAVWWWRRGRRAAAARAVDRMPAFYARALRALARRGLRPAPSETAREFGRRAAEALPAAAPALVRLTAGYERVRFGETPLDASERAELDACALSLR